MRLAAVLSILTVAAVVVAAVGIAGCGEKAAAGPHALGFANEVCPVEGGPVVTDNPALVVEHQGKKIGFCCPGCPQKFRQDPEKYMDLMRKDPAKYGFVP